MNSSIVNSGVIWGLEKVLLMIGGSDAAFLCETSSTSLATPDGYAQM